MNAKLRAGSPRTTVIFRVWDRFANWCHVDRDPLRLAKFLRTLDEADTVGMGTSVTTVCAVTNSAQRRTP